MSDLAGTPLTSFTSPQAVSASSVSAHNSPQEPRGCEFRLGLVLYGGVSLAIYIHGVCREFFRAVKGQGIYKLIKALTESDIVVDVISGTSAGGINGIMLGYALTNNRDFKSAAELWRRDGDFPRLLRSPNQDVVPPQSLLNSEGYYEPRLEAAYREMPRYRPDCSRGDDDASPLQELDLFITGTEAHGQVWTAFDDAGHPIDVKDHRALFLLKHRKGRKEPFNPTFKEDVNPEVTYQALAKLSMLTSCFPAAFAPVHLLKTDGAPTPDNLIWQWGKLNKPTGEAYFLDGGILNNKPFTATIREIKHRMDYRLVERYLLYVEPDPERFDAFAPVNPPKFFDTISGALVSIPGYQSIAADLQELGQHNTQVELCQRMTEELSSPGVTGSSDPVLMSLHRRSRLAILSRRVIEGVLRKRGTDLLLKPPEKEAARELVKSFDELMKCSQESHQDQILDDFDVHFHMRRLFHVIYRIESLLLYPEPPEPPGECKDNLRGSHKREKDAIANVKAHESSYIRVWYALNRQIKLLEILQNAMENLVDQAPIVWLPDPAAGDKNNSRKIAKVVWETVQNILKRLLNSDSLREEMPDPWSHYREGWPRDHSWEVKSLHDLQKEWLPQPWLTKLNEVLATRSKKIVGTVDDPPPAAFRSVLNDTHDCDLGILDTFLASDDTIRQAYDDFSALDAHLYPVQLASNLQSLDVIKTVRVSPWDAQRGFSHRSLEQKVAGKSLAHFGGFLKRSWRSNDILWGRLDTICQLTECLLKSDRFNKIFKIDDPSARARIRAKFDLGSPTVAMFDEDGNSRNLFPHSDQSRLKKKLEELLSGKATTETVDELMNLAVEAEQLEVLQEELPQVISDGIEEQREWNQFRVPVDRPAKKANGGHLRFETGAGGLSAVVVTAAAEDEAQHLIDQLVDNKNAPRVPEETPAGKFFRKDYKVGSENVKDIPPLVLVEIFATALLVLRNCVFGNLPEDIVQRIRGNRFYTVGFDYPVRALRSLVQFMRRAPILWQVIQGALCGASVVALLVTYFWHDSLIFRDAHIRWWPSLFLVVVPAIVLVAQGVFLWRGKVQDIALRGALKWRILPLIWCIIRDSALAIAILAAVAAPVLFLSHKKAMTQAIESLSIHGLYPWVMGVALFVVFPIVLPFLAGWGVTWIAANRSAGPRELRFALRTYFSSADLALLCRRLSLPWFMKQMAKQILESTYNAKGPTDPYAHVRHAVFAVKSRAFDIQEKDVHKRLVNVMDAFSAEERKRIASELKVTPDTQQIAKTLSVCYTVPNYELRLLVWKIEFENGSKRMKTLGRRVPKKPDGADAHREVLTEILEHLTSDEISQVAAQLAVETVPKLPDKTIRKQFADTVFREALEVGRWTWLSRFPWWPRHRRRPELHRLDHEMRLVNPDALS